MLIRMPPQLNANRYCENWDHLSDQPPSNMGDQFSLPAPAGIDPTTSIPPMRSNQR